MKITTVSLSRTIPTGAYMNDKIGIEASLEPGESESDVLHLLSARIEKWHKEANPHLYQDKGHPSFEELGYTPGPTTHLTPSVSPIEININHERIQIAIENATDPEELRHVKFDHPLMPASLMLAYNSKMEELTNGK